MEIENCLTRCLVEQADQPELFGRHVSCLCNNRATQNAGYLRVRLTPLALRNISIGEGNLLRFFDAGEAGSTIVFVLLRQLWNSEEKPNSEIQGLTEKILHSSTDHVIVADLDGENVGLAVFSIFCSDWLGGRFAYLHAFVIDSKYRGRGFGRQLADHLFQRMKDIGLIGVELDSGFQRTEAHAVSNLKCTNFLGVSLSRSLKVQDFSRSII